MLTKLPELGQWITDITQLTPIKNVIPVHVTHTQEKKKVVIKQATYQVRARHILNIRLEEKLTLPFLEMDFSKLPSLY